MELLVNDLSIHEQFHTSTMFKEAIDHLMRLHNVAKKFGRTVSWHSGWSESQFMPRVRVSQAIAQFLNKDQQRAFRRWLDRGPYWDLDYVRQHSSEDYLEYRGDVVTDTALGESAFRTLQNSECGLISLNPSSWTCSPLSVILRHGAENPRDSCISVNNWWTSEALENELTTRRPPPQSWDDVVKEASFNFANLIFGADCFRPLDGRPFKPSQAKRFLTLFGILDEIASEVNEDGSWSDTGQRIYHRYFAGDNALFSDSSDSEKQTLGNRLRFPHPENSQDTLFCSWHGKVRHDALRVYFSWPVRSNKRIYVVYAGPHL